MLGDQIATRARGKWVVRVSNVLLSHPHAPSTLLLLRGIQYWKLISMRGRTLRAGARPTWPQPAFPPWFELQRVPRPEVTELASMSNTASGSRPADGAEPDEEPTRSLVDLLIQAILNEKNSPEILQHQTEIVDELQAQLLQQDELVEAMERDPVQELMRNVYNLELKRIRYALRLYLRTRLHKLEAYAAHVLSDDNISARLSKLEQDYTQDYFVLVGRHLKAMFLDHLPEDFSSVIKSHVTVDTNDLVAEPLLDTHVFCSVLEDANGVQLEVDHTVDMKQGDLFIVRYESVATLVQQGKAVLV